MIAEGGDVLPAVLGLKIKNRVSAEWFMLTPSLLWPVEHLNMLAVIRDIVHPATHMSNGTIIDKRLRLGMLAIKYNA